MTIFERVYLGGICTVYCAGLVSGLALAAVAPNMIHAVRSSLAATTVQEEFSGVVVPEEPNMASAPSYSRSYGVVFEGDDAVAIIRTRDMMANMPAAKRITQEAPPHPKPLPRDAALVEAFGEDY